MTATDRQMEALALREQGIPREEIARMMGIKVEGVKSLLKSARRNKASPGQEAAVRSAGLSIAQAPYGWRKVKHEDGTSDSVFWRSEAATPESMAETLASALGDLPTSKPIKAPSEVVDDLLTLYPVMDMHLGMMAWGAETGGEDYDLKHARTDLRSAMSQVMALSPASDTGVLLIGGDFFHSDDTRAETPKSKHKLDMDGRYQKVLQVGIEILAEAIEWTAAKHKNVTVRVLRGNHDEHSHLVLTFALGQRYRLDDRITIDAAPRDLWMMRWGETFLSAHHGDKAPPERMALYLSDVAGANWAARHRYFLSGHVHHDKAKDIGPLRWESLRAFCPPDAYAASMGYGGRRALQAITFDKTRGMVLRAIDPVERSA